MLRSFPASKRNIKPQILAGLVASTATMLLYLLAVAAATPQFSPATSIAIALSVNGITASLLAIGMGIQVFLITYSRRLGCPVRKEGPIFGAGASGSVASALASFIALVPLGCCGMILYWLSLLPAILGVGATALLITYSEPLAGMGLSMMALSIIFMVRGIKHAEGHVAV